MGIKVKPRERPEYEPMEPGEYKAKLVDIQEDTESKYGAQVRFEFEVIDDEDYNGQSIRGWANLKEDDDGDYTFWEGTKLWEWVWALNGGKAPNLNAGFDLDDLKNNPCRIVVETGTKKDGTLTDRIGSVFPPKKGKAGKELAKEKQALAEAQNEEDMLDVPF